MREVAIFAFTGALALDVAGPMEVFAMANRANRKGDAEYTLRVFSRDGGAVVTASGISMLSERACDARAIDTLIVSGGLDVPSVAEDSDTIEWIRGAAARSRRICSVCTGAFLLAAAGLLEGRRAVTHWDSGPEFRSLHPQVKLDLQPIYMRDGPIWTSAGVTAGIDLALALVEEDLGRSVAIAIAQQLVVFLHRPGSQAQFSSTLAAQARAASRDKAQKFRDLHAWIAENLSRNLSVPVLAEHAGMSPRSFARLYAEAMGATPAKAVEQLRLEAAKRTLENDGSPLKSVAAECGFNNEERFRRAFMRAYHIGPAEYRGRFGVQLA